MSLYQTRCSIRVVGCVARETERGLCGICEVFECLFNERSSERVRGKASRGGSGGVGRIDLKFKKDVRGRLEVDARGYSSVNSSQKANRYLFQLEDLAAIVRLVQEGQGRESEKGTLYGGRIDRKILNVADSQLHSFNVS